MLVEMHRPHFQPMALCLGTCWPVELAAFVCVIVDTSPVLSCGDFDFFKHVILWKLHLLFYTV